MEEYKSNSHKTREKQFSQESVSKKKVEKVISGTVKTKKKNEIKKFADIFISEDAGNVKSYILMDVLIPAIKKAIDDIFTNGIRMLLWGDKEKSSGSSAASRLSYRRYYDKKDNQRESSNFSSRSLYNYDDIIFDNRGEAEEVLSRMDELISTYNVASVADLYDLVGITGNYTDYRYGWTDIRSASVVRIRDGYIIKLPKALPLN